MSAVPGAPLPLTGPPSPPGNPWTMFGTAAGGIAIVAGIIVMLVGTSDQNVYGASPAPLIIGAALLGLGALLLACGFVLAGVRWYLAHPEHLSVRGDGSDHDL